MLEPPDLPSTLISSCLQQLYGLHDPKATFLPLGYDINTAVYRVDTPEGVPYFLKLRKGNFEPIVVSLPHFLSQLGIREIIPALETCSGQLFGKLEQYTTILYPYIQGRNGYEVSLTVEQWIELGSTLSRIHKVQLPAELKTQIPCETYDPQWRESTRHFLAQVDRVVYANPIANSLANFMIVKRDLIMHILNRADALAEKLKADPVEFVFCHSDAHPGNYLITDSGEIYLVDWDNPIFAPREHDLMCIGGAMSGDQPRGPEERMFYQGYGPVDINQVALAYYRYERIIQDIAEFSKQILLSTGGGDDRAQSFQYFVSSFEPGSVLDAAMMTDPLNGAKA